MESLKNLETMVASWYKGMPHLPKNGQKWLAENIWWLALIGVILGGLSMLMALMATFFAGAVLTGFGGVAGAALGGVILLAVLVSLVLGAICLVIVALAISPLKAMKKKGWSLLFLVALLNVLGLVVQFLFNLNLVGLLWGLIVAAVGAYFLFEIRDQYHTDKKAGN